jgi:hypothetical protein
MFFGVFSFVYFRMIYYVRFSVTAISATCWHKYKENQHNKNYVSLHLYNWQFVRDLEDVSVNSCAKGD